jgi:hypothetical protein
LHFQLALDGFNYSSRSTFCYTVLVQVKRLLANANDMDALVEAAPNLLQASTCKGVLSEMQRLFGCKSEPAAVQLLQQNPSLVWSCQNLSHQSRGDRDADYLGDIFTPTQQEAEQ